MHADPVGEQVLVHVREVELARRVLARARRAGNGADDDRIGFDQPVLEQGGQGQHGPGWEAAGIGDQVGALDLVAEQLGQAVDGLRQIARVGVLLVELLVDGHVLEPIVGAEVDHLDARVEQLGHEAHRHLVGQAAQRHVGRSGELVQIQRFDRHVAAAAKFGEDLGGTGRIPRAGRSDTSTRPRRAGTGCGWIRRRCSRWRR